jgi:hypothetical protein
MAAEGIAIASAVGRWYDFPEFGVFWETSVYTVAKHITLSKGS